MSLTVIQAFDQIAGKIKIDADLIRRIHQYERNFVNRSEDHINFFGGHLIAVHKVRFMDSDWNNWFDNVLAGVDDVELRRLVHMSPAINKKWNVVSDVMNISCMWITHKILNSNLPEDLKRQGAEDALLIFYYKVLSSKLAHDFKFLINKDIAEAMYAQLSKKYGLKKYGSWNGLLRARVADILSVNGIHKNTLAKFTPDKDILYLISDSQGRIRDVVKLQHDMLRQTKDNDRKIVSTLSVIDTDEGTMIPDLARPIDQYRQYLISTLGNKQTFIKDDLLKVIASSLHSNFNPVMMKDILGHVSDHYLEDVIGTEKMINRIIIHAFDLLRQETVGTGTTLNMVFIITKLRGSYMSSRTMDRETIEIRNDVEGMIKELYPRKSDAIIATMRTGFMLYCVIRALALKKY